MIEETKKMLDMLDMLNEEDKLAAEVIYNFLEEYKKETRTA